MIKICFYSHTIDYAGTWRSHEKIFENLDRNLFDPYIMYWDESPNNNRLDIIEKKFGSNVLIPFKRSNSKLDASTGYMPITTNFKYIAIKNNFDIIHFARSGYYEWPFIDRMSKLQIETNIFGSKDNSRFLDKSISIAPIVAKMRGGTDIIIPNPIPIPKNIKKDFSIRQKFGIKDTDIVLGRVGRADNFTSIALEAFKKLQLNNIINVHFFILSPCDNTKKYVFDNNLKNVHFFSSTNDDKFIDLFHRNLDIYCHYRSDGEVHSVAISSAMSYELPVISHFAGYNGQIDNINNCGYIVNNSF